MISVLKRFYNTGRLITTVSLLTLFSASLPLSAFAQEGERAPSRRSDPQSEQQAKPPETPPAEKTAAPDYQEQKEGIVTLASLAPESQDPSSSGQTGQNPITQPLQLSPEVTRQRVGITEGKQRLITLQDAITLALQNNLDIEQLRQGVQIANHNLFASQGVYDIFSGATVNYRSQTFPVTSIFQGGDANASLNQKVFTYNFTTQQEVERTGGLWQVDFNNTRITTSSTASTLPTQFNPTLTFSFTQPLMRNFSIDQNRRQIQIAKRSLDLSDSQFRQQVIDIINSVQRAYWDLVFAIRNEKIARETVELTRTQLSNNQKMVEAGTLAPIELRSTEAALESRKGDVILALQGITTAENVLKGLLIKEASDDLWDSEITPTQDPQYGLPTLELKEASMVALQNRPELEQMRLQIEQKQIDIKFFENQTKPQVDFIGFYTNTGVAGTPSTLLTGGGGVDQFTVDLVNSLNQARGALGLNPFALPEPTPPRELGANVPDRFTGGYFQSLKNLFSQDFRTYQFGVNISLPWRNRTAQGNLGRTLAESRQLDARQRQLVQSIQIDVRNALQAVEATRQRFEAARANAIAAKAQLTGAEEMFRAGLGSNFLVLERQNDLAIAQGNEVRALTDYNKALADLQRVTGMTLTGNNIKVTALSNDGK
ncbi:MAG: TolC family protein [Blastocatellia bacterium]|nr:TolC family protein [Blastocatellia bacterium]